MAFIQLPGGGTWDTSTGMAWFDPSGETYDPNFTQAKFDALMAKPENAASATGYDGLTGYRFGGQGGVTMGLRGAGDNITGQELGGENAKWIRDPATGKDVPALQGPDGKYYRADEIVKKYGSIDPNLFDSSLFNARPSNDTFSGKDGLQDLIKIGLMAAPVAAGAAGLFGGASGAAGAGDAALAGGGEVGSGYAASAPGALETGTGLMDLGGGLGVDAYGNTAGGLFQGGAGTAGAGDFSGSVLGGGGTTGAAASGLGSILGNPNLIGAALGAGASLFGGGNSPAGSTTTTQDIPEWLKPFAMQGMTGLTNAYNATPDGVAPVTAAGNQYLMDVIGGGYLNNNPYLDAMFDRASGKVAAGVNSQFSSAGRYGSGAHTGVLTEGLGNLATDIYGKNYATERANQQAAAGGSAAFGNNLISQPFLKGQNLLQGVNSIRGGTTTQPYFQNRTADLLSGAVGGSILGNFFR